MNGRTFAIGDIHGEIAQLETLLGRLPKLAGSDTVLFIGDYLDRGPHPARVVDLVRGMPSQTPARVVALRGNHEDAWLRVRREGWVQFVVQTANGTYSTYRSFAGKEPAPPEASPQKDEYREMFDGSFFPPGIVDWMETLPLFWEDDHAIYVHAGLPRIGDRWIHPSEAKDTKPLMWQRSKEFYSEYDGKRVVFGHTSTQFLPQDISKWTPGEKGDLFLTDRLVGLDTGCGRGGWLTAVELPSLEVYESR